VLSEQHHRCTHEDFDRTRKRDVYEERAEDEGDLASCLDANKRRNWHFYIETSGRALRVNNLAERAVETTGLEPVTS
jgi:hypothetical protein